MDKTELDAVRASIITEYQTQIDKLKEEMNAELAALTRLEQRFKGLAGKQKSHRTKFPPGYQPEGKPPMGRERILAAKRILSGRFSRKDLHAAVNNDGHGEMKVGTFSPYVSELIGKEIVEVQKAIGNEPAVYMWRDGIETFKIESPAEEELSPI